jgi:AcrR family transcriptional regulator
MFHDIMLKQITFRGTEGKMQEKRKPKQNRGIETKNQIMEAGLNLFSKKGLHGTSSREIAAEAGVAIGSFYSYFKDKRDLFIELLKTHRINVMKILDQHLSKPITDMNQFEFIRTLINAIWESHGATNELDQKADILRVMDPEIDAILKEREEAGVNRLKSLLQLTKDRLRIKNIDVAALLVASIIRETFHSKAISTTADMHAIIDELSDMVSRYLFE